MFEQLFAARVNYYSMLGYDVRVLMERAYEDAVAMENFLTAKRGKFAKPPVPAQQQGPTARVPLATPPAAPVVGPAGAAGGLTPAQQRLMSALGNRVQAGGAPDPVVQEQERVRQGQTQQLAQAPDGFSQAELESMGYNQTL